MSIQLAPLWRQLAIVWLTAVVLAALLLALQFGGAPTKFFWLVPYPTWRTAPWMALGLFRAAPLFGSALAVVALAALLTLGLCTRRWGARARGRRTPEIAR
jgi:hypothetical protein